MKSTQWKVVIVRKIQIGKRSNIGCYIVLEYFRLIFSFIYFLRYLRTCLVEFMGHNLKSSFMKDGHGPEWGTKDSCSRAYPPDKLNVNKIIIAIKHPLKVSQRP